MGKSVAVAEQKVVNGVSVSDLHENMEAIKGTPEIAKFQFRAHNKWVKGGHNRTTISDFHGTCQKHVRTRPFVLDADEPPVLLGEDVGANPVEYALTALAACLTTGMVYHAAARGIELEEVESSLEGDLDVQGFLGMSEKVRNGYENIRVTFKIKGKNLTDKTRQQLIQIAQERSPVFDIVTNPVPVSVQLAKE